MRILVTGGTGFIGSHTVVELLNQDHEVKIVDNLSNSDESVLYSIYKITGKKPLFYKGDILNWKILDEIFKQHAIDSVIHFAGLKAVGESVENPLLYYHNNVTGTINLLKVMKAYNVKNIVFSSSATVYGQDNPPPFTEAMPRSAINPYGQSKVMIEHILEDLCNSDEEWKAILLRYFNPVGAHPSGLIGEDPKGVPNNLMPYITRVAAGRMEKLKIYGNDYDTKDGTGVRDYIHVMDLAKGHLKALTKLHEIETYEAYNLGTGKGYSVLEMVETFEKMNNVSVPYEIVERREGDLPLVYADVSKAEEELGHNTSYRLEQMVRDSWNFQKQNN